MTKQPLLIQLHIPFCPGRCVYCEETCFGQNVGYIPRYLLALEKELAAASDELEGYAIRSVHLHPDGLSLLGAGVLDDLLRKLEALLPTDEGTEWVVEAMPGDLSPELRHVLQTRHRVGRIVLELMGLSHEELRQLHRPYTENVAAACLRQLEETPLPGLDLRYALGAPGQTPALLSERMETLLRLQPGQISLRRYHDRRLAPEAQREYAEETDWAGLIAAAARTLEAAGYHRAGKSLHFAREGQLRLESRPEAAAWGVMGFGIGAVTALEGLRYRNTRDFGLYVEHSEDPAAIAELL